MKSRRTVIGAAALSLAVAGSLAGAGSAKADPGACVTTCELSPRVAALTSVLGKLNDLMIKFDSPIWKFETPLQKVHLVIEKWNPTSD